MRLFSEKKNLHYFVKTFITENMLSKVINNDLPCF